MIPLCMTRIMFTLDKTFIKKVVLSALCSFNHIVYIRCGFLFVYIKNFLYLCKELNVRVPEWLKGLVCKTNLSPWVRIPPRTPINLINDMKINFYVKTYKDKILILPREEFSYEQKNKTFMIKLGWLFWDLRLSFDF